MAESPRRDRHVHRRCRCATRSGRLGPSSTGHGPVSWTRCVARADRRCSGRSCRSRRWKRRTGSLHRGDRLIRATATATVVRERLQRACATLAAVHADVSALDIPSITTELGLVQRNVLGAPLRDSRRFLVRRQLELPVRLASRSSSWARRRRTKLATSIELSARWASWPCWPERPGRGHGHRERIAAASCDPRRRSGQGERCARCRRPPARWWWAPCALGRRRARAVTVRLLEPLVALADAVCAKIEAVVHEGIVAPLTDAVGTIERPRRYRRVVPVRRSAPCTDLVAKVSAIRPSTVLHDVRQRSKSPRRVGRLDPLGPVRAVVGALKAAIEEIASTLRPTVVLKPVYPTCTTSYESGSVRSTCANCCSRARRIDALPVNSKTAWTASSSAEHLQAACRSDGPSLPGHRSRCRRRHRPVTSLVIPAAVVALATSGCGQGGAEPQAEATTVNPLRGGPSCWPATRSAPQSDGCSPCPPRASS